MPARSLAESEGKPAPGDHRDRGPNARAGGPSSPDERLVGREPGRGPGEERLDRGLQGIQDRLVSEHAPPAPGQARPPRVESVGQGGEVDDVQPVEREARLDEQRPVERATGSSDASDQRMPDPPQQGSHVQGPDRLRGRLVRERTDHRLQARRHVRAVIAVPERGIQPVQERLVPRDRRRRARDESDHVLGGDRHLDGAGTHRSPVGSS